MKLAIESMSIVVFLPYQKIVTSEWIPRKLGKPQLNHKSLTTFSHACRSIRTHVVRNSEQSVATPLDHSAIGAGPQNDKINLSYYV